MENDLELSPLLTLSEAAQLLRISERTLRYMAQRDKLPAFKVGNMWRFSRSRLAKWILDGRDPKLHAQKHKVPLT